MKHLLLTTIAAVLFMGCGESQQSTPAPEAKPVEPVAEAAQPEPTGVKVPDNLIRKAVRDGNIEAVKQYLDAGTDVNAKDENGVTPLHQAAYHSNKETAELLLDKGADVNARDNGGETPLDFATHPDNPNKNKKETADLLRKHGGKTAEELKAEGK